MELAVLLAAGALSGLIAGLVGFAGGIVVVPALVWLHGPAVLADAIVVSWFVVFFNSIGAVLKQVRVRSRAERAELYRAVRGFVLGAGMVTPMVAFAIGGAARHWVTPTFVAVLQLCMAGMMLWPIRESVGAKRTGAAVDLACGGVVGGIATLIGVGGGSYTIAYFVYAARRNFQDAIAAANLTGFVIGTLSVSAYLLAALTWPAAPGGQANVLSATGMVVLIGSGVLASSAGVHLSRKLPTLVLRRLLVGALVLSAVNLYFS